jgi:hypothetical protein
MRFAWFKTNGSSILNGFLLLVLSVLIYHSNDKTIIGKEHLNLVEIVHGRVNNYKYKGNISPEETFGFSNQNLHIFPHHSPSLGRSKNNLLNFIKKRRINIQLLDKTFKKNSVLRLYMTKFIFGVHNGGKIGS